MSDWYDSIEEPIRDVVKLLRDNGFNTMNSCGHEMTIECNHFLNGESKRLYYLVYDYLKNNNKEIKFSISTHSYFDNNTISHTLIIRFPENQHKLERLYDIRDQWKMHLEDVEKLIKEYK